MGRPVVLISPTRDAEPAPPKELTTPAPKVHREAMLVGLGALCAYALTLSAVPALTHDSLTYVEAIERGGAGLFHPHHLAYNVLARGWLGLTRGLGITADPLRVIAMLDAVLGAIVAGLVWLILRIRAGLPRQLAAAGTAGASLSFGVWFYSVSVEVYLLPLVLLLTTFLVLSAPMLSVRRMAVIGALNGLAVLGHQVNVLFGLVVLVAAFQHADRTTAIKRMTAYAGAATAVVAAAYTSVLVLVIKPGSVSEARSWFTGFADSGTYWELGPTAPIKAAVGFTRSVVGGHFSFRLDWVRDRMLSTFPDRSLDDEVFLVRNVPSAVAWMLTVVAGLVMVMLVVALIRGFRRRGALPNPTRRVTRLLVTWFVAYAAFFMFWEPVNLEFWIPQVAVLWMVTVTLWAPAESDQACGGTGLPKGAAWLGLTAGAMVVVNLFGTILPATDEQNDLYALRYATLANLVEDGDLVVVEYPHLGVPYADRLTEAEALSLPLHLSEIQLEEVDQPTPADLIGTMDEALTEGATVVVDPLLIARPDTDRSRELGVAIEEHYGDRLHPVEIHGADGWLVIDDSSRTPFEG